jgi:hypothetical protein
MVIGYAYEADTHCVKHTQQRFGRNPATATDGEGNPVHPIFSGTSDAEGFYCSECVYIQVQRRCARRQKATKR